MLQHVSQWKQVLYDSRFGRSIRGVEEFSDDSQVHFLIHSVAHAGDSALTDSEQTSSTLHTSTTAMLLDVRKLSTYFSGLEVYGQHGR